jgi:hypothetical protein
VRPFPVISGAVWDSDGAWRISAAFGGRSSNSLGLPTEFERCGVSVAGAG